ncbi:MAG: hypothetical protein Q4C82_06110, partial [Eubacteriales bacterium]|nr:hypothetical protein [Eubacteriales bacterium]
ELTEDCRLTGEGGGVFAFFAPVYDSAEPEGTWHRLSLEGSFEGCKYEILAAAFDAAPDDDLPRMTADELEERIQSGVCIRRAGADDLLLHELTGRYLWVLIKVYASRADSRFSIDGFRVEFPWSSFSQYLPEIYQESGRNAFFERYMAVLQSLYEDLERQVERIPEYLDYESAPPEQLPMFAAWTGGWAAGRGYSGEQLRFLLGKLQEIQSGRGTGAVMQQMLLLATGRKAVIVEYFKWHDWMRRGASQLENYERLFGRNEDTFTVVLDTAEMEKPPAKHQIRALLEEYTPLGMHCNLVLLRWSSHMDQHCYLDKNSRLSVPAAADTAGFVLGGNYVLG